MIPTKDERRVFSKVLISLIENFLDAQRATRVFSVEKKRVRRTRVEAGKLRRKVRAARKANKPVRVIAQELGITPAYIYQMARKTAGNGQVHSA